MTTQSNIVDIPQARAWPRLLFLPLIGAALVVLPFAIGSDGYLLHVVMSVFIFATLGQAWNLMAGYAGLLTFGQQAMIGLGGFGMAIIHFYAGMPIWIAWIGGGVVALAFGWLLCMPLTARSRSRKTLGVAVAIGAWILYEVVIAMVPAADVFGSPFTRRAAILLVIFLGALPVMKLAGPYFAIATWLTAESVATLFFSWNVTGAGSGMQVKTEVSTLTLYYVALGLLSLATALIYAWMKSDYGLALTAVRDDPVAAESGGVNVEAIKAMVFIFASGLTGLAAGLYFIDVIVITPASAFTINWASIVVFIVVAGGMGTVAGPLLGACLYILVERLLTQYADQGMLVLGVLSILLMLFLPRGILGLFSRQGLPQAGASNPLLSLLGNHGKDTK